MSALFSQRSQQAANIPEWPRTSLLGVYKGSAAGLHVDFFFWKNATVSINNNNFLAHGRAKHGLCASECSKPLTPTTDRFSVGPFSLYFAENI
jgi:hypothetical protein